jgi:hypothetical protein
LHDLTNCVVPDRRVAQVEGKKAAHQGNTLERLPREIIPLQVESQ